MTAYLSLLFIHWKRCLDDVLFQTSRSPRGIQLKETSLDTGKICKMLLSDKKMDLSVVGWFSNSSGAFP